MPELPEVETVARSLVPSLKGRIIRAYRSYWPGVLHDISSANFRHRICGRLIINVRRRAKFIVIQLDQGYILVHLRMTGKLFPFKGLPEKRKHISALFRLSGKLNLIFNDTRKFGRIYYFPDTLSYKAHCERLGPEPLGRTFTPVWLRHNLSTHKRQIKPLLLDQAFLAGLGNIYVDEVLFRAGIHPAAASNTIKTAKINRLHASIQTVLRASIRSHGTTLWNFTYSGKSTGKYREELQVFGRQGKSCMRCGDEIKKIRVAQRGTHYCARCQKQ